MNNDFTKARRAATSQVVAWYLPDQWEQLRATAKDPERIPATFDEWHSIAGRRLKELEAEGGKIEKVIVEIPALLNWLKAKGLDNTTENRAAYAAYHYEQMN